ncbi:MAG TPA: glycosyltransferase family 4 protein [Longimicrobiaceae bacterium]|nr:glycosyltransferase family 4 protein [Longimicrobiaceae bacterium]
MPSTIAAEPSPAAPARPRGRILFLDAISPNGYGREVLSARASGGTQSSIVRVAESLAGSFEVVVAQIGRTAPAPGAVRYVRLVPAELEGESWDAIVAVRHPQAIPMIRARLPEVPLFLWMQDLVDWWPRDLWAMIARGNVRVVANSHFHRRHMLAEAARSAPDLPALRITTIPNPVDDSLGPDGTPVDPEKLVFFSAPSKGLRETLELFRAARAENPAYRLYVANPGYQPVPDFAEHPGVVDLGPLPQGEVLRHVREALCVFYPNRVYAETFGLVFAESNAVGTPVLTHPLGAAPEVLRPAGEQIVNCADPAAVLDRLREWRAGNRPAVHLRGRFRLRAVARAWERLLGSELPARRPESRRGCP